MNHGKDKEEEKKLYYKEHKCKIKLSKKISLDNIFGQFFSGPRGTRQKPSEMRPSATRRQVQDGWSPACKGIQHTVLKALFRIMSLTVIPSQFHMLAVLQVYMDRIVPLRRNQQ